MTSSNGCERFGMAKAVFDGKRRNHYMTLWIRNNVREGIIKPVSIPAVPIISRESVLNIVPGLAAQRTHLKCVPKAALRRLAAYLQSGDLMFSCPPARIRRVSIVRDASSILMRHASRSQGFVVERELREFLKANRMAGVIVVRPQGVTRRIAQTEDGAKLWVEGEHRLSEGPLVREYSVTRRRRRFRRDLCRRSACGSRARTAHVRSNGAGHT